MQCLDGKFHGENLIQAPNSIKQLSSCIYLVELFFISFQSELLHFYIGYLSSRSYLD